MSYYTTVVLWQYTTIELWKFAISYYSTVGFGNVLVLYCTVALSYYSNLVFSKVLIEYCDTVVPDITGYYI